MTMKNIALLTALLTASGCGFMKNEVQCFDILENVVLDEPKVVPEGTEKVEAAAAIICNDGQPILGIVRFQHAPLDEGERLSGLAEYPGCQGQVALWVRQNLVEHVAYDDAGNPHTIPAQPDAYSTALSHELCHESCHISDETGPDMVLCETSINSLARSLP